MRETRGPQRRAGLSRERVIDAALELSEGRGLHGWTQRDLAARLDVVPSVLYHHAGGRDEVLRGVVERILVGFPTPSADLPWEDWFRALLYPARPILLRYPGTAKWLLMHGPAFPAITRTIDAGIAALRRAGFASPAFVYAAVMNTAMLTISVRDDRLDQADDGPRDHESMLQRFSPLRVGSSGVATIIDELIVPILDGQPAALLDTHEQYYRFVLEAMIAGVRTMLPGSDDSKEPPRDDAPSG